MTTPSRRLLIMGDSIANGGQFAFIHWGVLLQSARAGQKFGVHNAAVPGYTCAQALAQFQTSYDTAGYTHLLLLVGTNDLAAGTSAATIQATLATFISAAQAAGLDVTICTILPRSTGPSYSGDLQTRLETVNAWIMALEGVTAVDLYTLGGEPGTPTQLKATWDTGDGLHPNNTGHAAMAAGVDSAVSW
jgi:lysophospholipase L1-like esterase